MTGNPPDIYTYEKMEEEKEYLRTMIRRAAFKHPVLTIPEYAEKYIRIQAGPKTGPFSLASFPPIEEPLYNMGPQSSKQQVFVMASIQTVKTIFLDICAQYYTDHSPQDQLFVSSTERLGKKWRIRRYEPMLNASGARDRRFIGAFTESKTSRRSGETMWSVEYDGKTLDIGTSNSASSLSADTKRILLADEIARWPEDVGKEGHPWQVAIGRVTAWKHMGKAAGVSSPLIAGTCKMEELANSGDYRQFQAVCPFCGRGQFLVRGSAESNHGLKFETKGGRLDSSSIHYLCDFCHEAIFEHQKVGMLQKNQLKPILHPERTPDKAIWIPTKTPEADFIASYQIGALYSPFFSWQQYVHEYRKAIKNPEKMQTFTNQRDGLPFKIQGMKPELEKVLNLRGDYESRQIPHEVLYLTAAVDIQHGQENWETDTSKEKPRLELEIKGHGDAYRLFGIQYKVFDGYLEDIYSGAWDKLRRFINEESGFVIESRGMIYDVKICMYDASSSKYTDQIYSFCREMGSLKHYPLYGFNTLQRQKKEMEGKDSGDERSIRDYDRFRRKQENDIIAYQISTYIYKLALYSRLNTSINFVQEKAGETTPAGFQGFPSDYTDHYFDMLLSEEHLPDKTKFQQTKKRNEALDISVYNMAAGEIWIYQQVTLIRAKFAALRVPAQLLQGITGAFIMKMLKSGKAKGRALTTAEITQQLKGQKK